MQKLEHETNEQNAFLDGSKRRITHVIFGRSLVVILLLLLQFYILFSVMFSLAQRVPLPFGGMLVFTAVMLIWVLNGSGNPSVKLSWCIVIGILPIFGALLYFFVRLEWGHRLEQKLYDFTVKESAPYVHQRQDIMEKLQREDKSFHSIAAYLQNVGNFPIYGNTEVTYFPLGEDKFEQMLVQLEKAEKFIFMEYFIISKGYMWSRVLEILTRKAKEGVDVRVLYDGTCAVALLPYSYPKELQKLGIRCKMFSPIRPLVSTHYNNRDHRKILVIDGQTAFTGGVNIEDCYINREERYGHWKDTAVMVHGEAAQGFTMLFLQMWNSTEKQRVYEPYLTAVKAQGDPEGYVIPYGDIPTDRENVGEMVYLNIINQAKDYVYIMTPYLILDYEMVTALRFAAKRGVDVRIILPHIPDKKYAFVLAKNHYRELTEAGVKIYEYTPGFVHAKVFLSDDIHGVVGTINLDYRSLYLHFECAAYLYKVSALADIHRDFQETMEKSQLITINDITKRSLLSRIAGAVLKVAAPLM